MVQAGLDELEVAAVLELRDRPDRSEWLARNKRFHSDSLFLPDAFRLQDASKSRSLASSSMTIIVTLLGVFMDKERSNRLLLMLILLCVRLSVNLSGDEKIVLEKANRTSPL